MNKTHIYMASLCWRGLLGGWLVIDDERVTYHTGKLQVPAEIRELPMPFCRITAVERSKLAFLPTVTIRLQNGREWQFLVLGRKSFLRYLEKAMTAYG